MGKQNPLKRALQEASKQVAQADYSAAEVSLDSVCDVDTHGWYGFLDSVTFGDAEKITASQFNELAGAGYSDLGDFHMGIYDLAMRNSNEVLAFASIKNASRCYGKARKWVTGVEADLAIRISYGDARIALIQNQIDVAEYHLKVIQNLTPLSEKGWALKRFALEGLKKLSYRKVYDGIHLASELTDLASGVVGMANWLGQLLSRNVK